MISGAATVEGRTGKVEIVVTKEAHRSQAWISGLFGANGVDASGAWSIEGGSGLVERQLGIEAIAPLLEAWLLRRTYVTAFDAAHDSARCEDMPSGGSRVDLAFRRPELGSPVLAFDLESGALIAVAHEQADGKSTHTTYEGWSEADRGVRWPRKTTEHPLASSATALDYTLAARGLDCVRFDATGVAVPERGAPCAAPPPDRFVLSWPAGDRPRVRLPFTYLGSELVVRAKIGGRDAFAFLDSGASATAVDATTPAGAAFHAAIELTGSGSTQRVRVGFGELPTIDLAELHAEHVPTVSVPIPALDAFGDKRPELILGYSFFAAAVVRVDYKRMEVVFAKSTDGMFARSGPPDRANEPRAVPLRVLRSKIVVDGAIEGTPAAFEVDTGNSGGLDLYKRWATAHGLPGTRPVVDVKGRFGAGSGETEASFFRLGKASLGPIAFDGHLTHIGDLCQAVHCDDAGIIAGLAGNEVLARCDAVVFDVPKRKLWLEGACDRPVPERRVGWRFEKKLDPSVPERPWVIARLWPGGPAERAGVQLGDRVMEMGGKPATADVAPLWAMEQQPAGTKLPVVLRRGVGPAPTRITIELRPLAP